MTAARGRKRTILLVEDNETIRHAFGILLADSGFEVAEAGSGGEALKLAEDWLPDVVLMDLGLPDADGLEVTRRLKSNPRTRATAVIAITGRAMETDERACLDAGCDAYLAKPVDTALMMRTIEEIMGREEREGNREKGKGVGSS